MLDLIIIGAGIAGMTASIYASRYGLSHLIFGEDPGGQGNLAHLVENYPGIFSIRGPDLMQEIIKQVENYGVKIRRERVGEIKLKSIPTKSRISDGVSILSTRRESSDLDKVGTAQNLKLSRQYVVKTIQGAEYQARSLILAMGALHRHLNVPGEEKFLGRGVSYCTCCDAPLYREKRVAMVGGGNAAVTGALHLASFAKKVYLIHRRDELRAEKAWIDKMKKSSNIELILSTVVKEVYGKEKVEGVVVAAEVAHENLRGPLLTCDETQGVHNFSGAVSKATSANFVGSPPQVGKEEKLTVDGLFIEAGKVPSSTLATSLGLKVDERGYVLVGSNMETNIPGVFAAGDLCLQKEQIVLCQFIAAAADGARAAASVYHYLSKKAAPPSWGEKKA